MNKGKNRKLTLAMVYNMDNIHEADNEARVGKIKKYGVRKFDCHKEENLRRLSESIKNGTFKTMPPVFEERFCDKKMRVLAKIHYPYHVAHHALMRVIMPTLMQSYYYESGASIKGRGIHYMAKHVRKWIDRHKSKPIWWVQLDFEKFYHHIVRQKLYDRLCKTFGDEGIRWMLHDIIWALGNHNGIEPSDGTRGVGIGLYPIQPLVNFYMNDLCRDVARFDVKLFVYCDNLLLMGHDTKELQDSVEYVINYAKTVLEQPLHKNYGIQRLDDVHPVDFVGYCFHPDFTFVRKATKYRFKKKFNKTANDEVKRKKVLASYNGWLKHCNGLTLWQKVTGMKRFSELNIDSSVTLHDGKKFFDVPSVSAHFLVNREIIVKDFEEDVQTRNGSGRMCVLVEENGSDKKFLTNNPRLKDVLIQVREIGELPFTATLRSRAGRGNVIDYYLE